MLDSPVAPRLPFVGNGIAFMRAPLRFLQTMRDRHGDVVKVALGPMEATLVSHPDLVEDILVTRNRLWRKDEYLRTSLRPVLGMGLLSSEGDFWRRQRRLAQPAFHRERIANYGAIMVEHSERLAARWRHGEVRDLHADMMRLTLEIVAQALFGASVGNHASVVSDSLHVILSRVADPWELFFPVIKHVPSRKKEYARAIERLDAIIYEMIERRRKSGEEADDLLSMLLHARDEDGSRMSDVQLRDECMTLFLAGHETTAIALSWTWFLLSKHPRVRAKLETELDSVREADPSKLRYTQHVVAESLRMYPPAWSMGREALEDHELGGFRIHRGENVWFCPWSIQRDARWFDDPETFRPERWEGDLQKRLHRYAYFPFGGGPRLCIGQSFAQMEAVLLLATLARAFRADVLAAPVPQPSVTLRPKHGLRARLSRR
jgi:cytochrome P450